MMNPGVTFTREAAQRIIRAVRVWERTSPVVSRPVRRTPLLADDDCVYVINNQGANAVAGSLLKLDSWSVTESRYGVSRPDATGLTEIGIACGAIDDGSEGWAWMTGTHVVLASAYADLTFGDKIGSQADSWYAAADDSGVLRVLGGVRAADQPGGLPEGVGLVRAQFFRDVGTASTFRILDGAATLDISGSSVFSRTQWQASRTWTAVNTSTEGYRALLQFQSPIVLTETNDTILLVTANDGPRHLHAEVDAVTTYFTTQHTDLTWPYVYIDGITESFDVSSDDYAILSSLSVTGDPDALIGKQFRVHGTDQYANAEELIYAGRAAWTSGTIYGLQITVGGVTLQTLTASGWGRIRLGVEDYSTWQYGVVAGAT